MQAAILAFVKVLLDRIQAQASSSPDVDQAVAAVRLKVEYMIIVYSEAEMKDYLDLSVDSLRDGQAKDIMAVLEVRTTIKS